jgi:hypothetical protein
MELHGMGFASRAWCGPLVFGLLLLAAAPRDTPSAAPIAAAAGHPSRLHLRATTTRVRDNRTIVETVDVAGTRRLVRRCREDLCTGTWFDGKQLADFGINGTPFPQTGSEVPILITYAAIISTAFAEPDFSGRVEALTSTGDTERFRVAVGDGTPLVAVANARTHELLRIEQTDGSVLGTLSSNHVGDVTLYGDRAYQTVVRVAEPLREPAGPPTTVSGESDVPIVSPTLPIVPCVVDGQRANCLIDTGTTPSGMTLDFAERLKREPHGEMEISALGSYVTGVIDVASLTIGSASIKQLRTVVVPQTRGLNFDIILGSDALAGMRIIFDPARRSVHIGESSARGAGTEIPLHFDGGVPYVTAKLSATSVPQRLVFDTGDNGTFSIPFEAYRANSSLFPPLKNVKTLGLGGSADAIFGQLPSASIGPLTLERADIQAVRGLPEGHIGYALAARCGRLAIDFTQRRIDCFDGEHPATKTP